MVLGAAVRIARTVFKHRKLIYKTLVAQDRAIDKAARIGGYGRQARMGLRHGAVGGSFAGSLISSPGEEDNNGLQKKQQYAPRKFSQTRYRFSTGRTRKLPAACYPRRRRIQRRARQSYRM